MIHLTHTFAEEEEEEEEKKIYVYQTDATLGPMMLVAGEITERPPPHSSFSIKVTRVYK